MTSSCRIHLSTGPGRSPSRNYSQWGRKSKEDAILDEQLARAAFNCWSLSDLVRWLREPRQAVADEMAPEYCLGTGCPVPPKELQPEDPYVLSVCLQHSCPNVCEPRPELGIRNDCSLSARNRACSSGRLLCLPGISDPLQLVRCKISEPDLRGTERSGRHHLFTPAKP